MVYHSDIVFAHIVSDACATKIKSQKSAFVLFICMALIKNKKISRISNERSLTPQIKFMHFLC